MDESIMTNYDVFNGDTDGIFARHQLRLAIPLDTVNISGVKRDVNLLRHVDPVEGDLVTVLDISHAKIGKMFFASLNLELGLNILIITILLN